MNDKYFSVGKGSFWKHYLLLVGIVLGTWSNFHAQNSGNYTFSTNSTSSLQDMSTGTTQIVGPGLDATASAVTPIGFTFYLMGNAFTNFSVNDDGLLQLGNTAVGTNIYTISGGTAAAPRMSAFNADLRTGTTGKVHYKVIGSAPNRKLVVEYLNMQLFYTAATSAGTATYQVVLSETTGQIDFIYGAMSATDVTTGNRSPSIGFYIGSAAGSFASVAYATHTSTTTGTYTANPAVGATGPIANLTSAADGTRRIYSYTPAVPNAPSALSFTSVGSSYMNLNWTDNATNELGFAIFRSTDGITYTQVGTAPANATSFFASGLTASTLYYWNVHAYTEGALSTPALSGTQATSVCTAVSGIKTVGAGGDYPNLTTAFSDINSCTLAGNTELQLIAGYPAVAESYPIVGPTTAPVGAFTLKLYPTVSGLSITSNNTTGTLNLNNTSNLTIDGRVNQTGANDLIIANTNVGASYAVQLINDARNNSLINLFIQSTNNSTTSGTIVIGTTTGTNGNDNNTIDNCDIRDGATTPTNAIYSVGTTTTATHFNDNITISNNRISNFFNAGSATIGVFAGSGNNAWTITNNKLFQTASRTYTSGNTHNGIQVSHTNGNGFVITGNTIGYASASATGTYTMTSTATRFIGINVSVGTTTATSVQGNTISGINLLTTSGAATGNGILAGINITNGNVNVGNVTPNVIGNTTGNDAIVATTATSGGIIVGINSSSAGAVTIANNHIGSLTGNGSTATSPAGITGIQVSAGTPTITGNTIGSITTSNSFNNSVASTGGTQLIRGIDVTGGSAAALIQNNIISNLTQSGTSATSNIRGIVYGGTGNATINQNSISNLTGANGNTTIALTAANGPSVAGIVQYGAATGGGTISNNTIQTLSATNATAVQTNVVGIAYGAVTSGTVTKNKIFDLRNASTMTTVTTPPVAAGILLRAVATGVNVNNNMISLGDAQTTNTQFVGVWSQQNSPGINVYHNSISISGTAGSGALPSYGFQRGDNSTTAVTAAIDFRNNIVSNTRSGGTGKHYAIANQSAAPSTTGWGLNASNYNVLNTANAATVGLWGSTDAAFNPWRVASNGDANSFSAITVTFVNTAGGDLHLNMGVTPTPIESGGATIASVTTDYDGQARPGPAGSVNGGGTSPDLGADEIDAAPALPVITLNSVTPPTTTQCTATARLVSVNITTPVGTVVSASIGYTVNGVAQTPISMTNTTGTTWEGTIPVPTPANATIAWGVSATNSSALTGSYVGTPYFDEPLFGVVASATNSAATICSGNSSTLTATLSLPGQVQLGTGTTTTALTAQPTAFCNRWSSYRMQTVYTAAELNAAGLHAGPITAIAYNIISLGSAATNANFVVKVGTTGLSSFTDFISNAGFTTVFPAATYTHAVGLNTITFSTPYNWDGVSNLVIEMTHDGANSTNNAETYYTATATNMVAWSINGAATGTLSVNRLNIRFSGNTAPTVTAYAWSDGVGTVGTTNPLTVNPTTTTTYTANMTAAGCPVTPAPTTTVTVNPLPTAPTTANSAQCGTQVPTASVTSTSGLPTPTFIWYDAAVAGTALQTSTSTTYTSNVATTTTFYVSELNTATGCESARTAITVTVASADGILASANNATICIGSSVTLSASNTNPTPNQNYTYTWSGTAGSGLASQAGTSITVTPTVPGTYTYSLSGVDGGCSAVSSVNVTVDPFASTVTPINVTCNGYNNGSFSQGATSCGTGPYTYSVDGGAFGAIPTNLAPGTYAIVTMNSAGFTSAAQNITITQPSTTISTPTGTNAAVCQNGTVANVSATSTTNAPGSGSQTLVVSFNVAAQPTETNAAPGNIVSSATYAALPAGSTITGGTLVYNGLTATGGSWMSDIRLGFSGAVVDAAAQGTGSTNVAGTFNYTRAIPAGAINAAGGTVNLLYWDYFSDNAGAEATFPTGSGVATLTITYTPPAPATISWWDNASGGTQIGTGSPLNAVGTSVLPNTSTPGTYTLYAQGEYGGCSGVTRTAVTVTVNALPTVGAGTDQTVCAGTSVTLNGSGATSYSWDNSVTNGVAFTPASTMTYTVTGTDGNGCQNTDQVLVTVNALPTVSAGVDQSVCTGGSVTLSGAGTATGYTWNNGVTDGVAFTPASTMTYTVTGTDGNGCQNTDDVVVTVNVPTSGSETQTACSSFTWSANGTTYTTSGTYTATLTNAAGCDSIVTLNLTINQPSTGSETQTACDSYTWPANGTTYTMGGTYTATLTNAVGCDSIVTLNLTINQSSTGSETQTACASYTWPANGTTYTTSGTYTTTLTNAAGCDSIITLNLTINQPSTGSETQTACDSYTWPANGTMYTSSGTYTATLTNAAGCDSIVTLNLTINQSSTGSETQTACDSYTWPANGTTYTMSGTYTATLTNAAGCDSIVTLNLTINTAPTATATDNGDGTITASAGSTYQWIDCSTGNPIVGATTQTYTVTANGNYAVVVSNASGCSDTSACVLIDYIGIEETASVSISVYPNPTHNEVTVVMSASAATIEVVDAQGKLLQVTELVSGGKVDLSAYETGVYFLRIKTENGSVLERIVKN